MIQYKLIKCYPGFTELGKIEDSENVYKTGWKGTNFYDAHPEFWQKVEELDYEILSYSETRSSLVINYRHPIFRLMKDSFENDKETTVFIFSVKRLSDGEVFTIGDEIDFRGFGEKGIVPIERFEVDYFDKNEISAYNSAFGLGLYRWEKATKKTPLFNTEDGVGIFEGDNYYYVTNDFIVGNQICSKDHKEFTHNSRNSRFSTKEKAEEYILLNKSLLSLNDLLAVWGNAEHPEKSPLFKRFEELAKSKL